MLQDEKTNSILEALNVLKSWNESWSPKVVLVDNYEEEINALEAAFPGEQLARNFQPMK